MKIFGGAERLLFLHLFDRRPPPVPNGIFLVLGIKWAPPLVMPETALSPVCPSPLEKSTPCKFWEGLVQLIAWKVATLILASSDLGGQIWPYPVPHFWGAWQLLFYAKNWFEALFCPKWPFFSFGHKMGILFGHPSKKIYVPMTAPIEKEDPMQNLERIGPTVSIKSGSLDFGLKWPWRSDLTSSSPPFLGVPNNFYFLKKLIPGLFLPEIVY